MNSNFKHPAKAGDNSLVKIKRFEAIQTELYKAG
jgi:hypothetical protein